MAVPLTSCAQQAAAPSAAAPAAISPERSRLGINLNGPADWNSELPFTDVFKLSREWISQKEGAGWGKGPALERDESGWIKRLESGCFAETPMLTLSANTFPSGEYVCLYEGKGQIEFTGSGSVKTREAGRIVVNVDAARGGLFLQIRSTDPSDYVRNIRFLMPGFEKTYKEQPFNPVFFERWKSMNALRFMDWMETNNSKVKEWSQRPTPTYCNYTERGVPVEVMIDLCNRMGSNPWFCMPHEASDDYVANFARLVKATLNPKLTAYVEYSNEVWNGMFAQSRYAGERGQALGFAKQPWEAGWKYTGRRSKEIFRIWEREMGGRDRLVRVIATQAGNDYVAGQILGFEDTAANCDALAIAPYISMNLGPGTTPSSDAVAGWSVDQVLDHLEQKALPESVEWIRKHKALADRYKIRLIQYESGQHAVGIQGGENNEKLTQLLHQANRHARMGDLYTKYLDAWKTVGGGDLCCLFASTGGWSKWGSWGLLEHNGDDTPKYRAVMRWNAANPRPAGTRAQAR